MLKDALFNMVIFYTHTQKTERFATTCAKLLNTTAYQLKSNLENKQGFSFMFTAIKLAFTRKSYPVDNMPTVFLPNTESNISEIYVCSPIWGGAISAPIKYFLENAKLKNIKVNLLLTAAVPTEKYRDAGLKYLQKLPCIPGAVHLFATGKILPEEDILIEQLQEILFDDPNLE